ncbi:MAG: DUF3181 family protein [Cyanophyceae cyanobacterium]
MAHAGTTREIEALAAAIGELVYLDLAKWHLYLSNAQLHVPVAEALYPLLEAGEPTQAQVETVLQQISVPLGGGRRSIPLRDAVPDRCLSDLLDRLRDYRRDYF